MLRLLQVANVGKIVGGTAACAWTITKALPWAEHHVAFLSPISGDTRAEFRHVKLLRWETVTAGAVARLAPHVVLLHNTPQSRADARLPAVTLQYLHSRITPARADRTLYCSRWLAAQYGNSSGDVLHQAVPIPVRSTAFSCDDGPAPFAVSRTRNPRDPLLIGRLCTPQARKWPPELADFYRQLAGRFPNVRWEFVGCPPSLQLLFRRACGGRAEFHDPGWQARSHLARWDALLYHHPTLTESFGRTCAEAMRAGCIPVVDDRGGFPEQMPPQHPSAHATGFLCRTPEDFQQAIERLHDPARRTALSAAARAHADREFSLAAFAGRFVAILKEVVGARGVAGVQESR